MNPTYDFTGQVALVTGQLGHWSGHRPGVRRGRRRSRHRRRNRDHARYRQADPSHATGDWFTMIFMTYLLVLHPVGIYSEGL